MAIFETAILIAFLDWILELLWTVAGLAFVTIILVAIWRFLKIVNIIGKYYDTNWAYKIAKIQKVAAIRGLNITDVMSTGVVVPKEDEIESELKKIEEKESGKSKNEKKEAKK